MQLEELRGIVATALGIEPPSTVVAACCGSYAPYYHLVYLLAQRLVPCTVVELGVAYGRFIHCASLAHADNKIIGVDVAKQPELEEVLRIRSNVSFYHAASVPVPEGIVGPIDVLHIDTLHTYDQARPEFEAYFHLLADGAIVLFDDLHAAEDDVLRYFNELPFPKIQEDRLHDALGYGVVLVQGGYNATEK